MQRGVRVALMSYAHRRRCARAPRAPPMLTSARCFGAWRKRGSRLCHAASEAPRSSFAMGLVGMSFIYRVIIICDFEDLRGDITLLLGDILAADDDLLHFFRYGAICSTLRRCRHGRSFLALFIPRCRRVLYAGDDAMSRLVAMPSRRARQPHEMPERLLWRSQLL